MPIYSHARHISLPQCRHVIYSRKISFFSNAKSFSISCQYIFAFLCELETNLVGHKKIPTKALVLPYDVIQCKDLGDDKLGQCWPFLALLVTITLLCGQTMTLGSHTLLQKLQLNAIKAVLVSKYSLQNFIESLQAHYNSLIFSQF